MVIHELLEQYCKYKRIKLEHPNSNTYVLHRRHLKILTLRMSKTHVLIDYELSNSSEEVIYGNFLKYLKKEIEKEKTFRKFASYARPVKKLQYHKMKMTEYGREHLRNRTESQNVHASERVAITCWNKKRYRKS